MHAVSGSLVGGSVMRRILIKTCTICLLLREPLHLPSSRGRQSQERLYLAPGHDAPSHRMSEQTSERMSRTVSSSVRAETCGVVQQCHATFLWVLHAKRSLLQTHRCGHGDEGPLKYALLSCPSCVLACKLL